MKPPPFVYHVPTSLDEAHSVLAELGDEGRILARAQSLIPLMNFRLARPSQTLDHLAHHRLVVVLGLAQELVRRAPDLLTVLGRMVRATLRRRGRAMLIGVLTILVFTGGASAHMVHAVIHGQTPGRQVLATQRVMPQPVVRMVAVGDSITKGDWDVDEAGGWVTRLATKLRAAYPQATFQLDNAGVDGDTTAGVLARLAPDVLAPHPQLVIVSIGTNDFNDGVPRTQFAQQLQALVHRLRAAPQAPLVILASMLPFAGQAPGRLATERAYNDVIHRVAAATHVGYLDLFDAWLGLGPSYLRALRHDTVHPNPIGYEWIASTMAAFLEAGYFDAQGRVIAPRAIPTSSPVLCGSA